MTLTAEQLKGHLREELEKLLLYLPSEGDFKVCDEFSEFTTLESILSFVRLYTRIGRCDMQKVRSFLSEGALAALLGGTPDDERYLNVLYQQHIE